MINNITKFYKISIIILLALIAFSFFETFFSGDVFGGFIWIYTAPIIILVLFAIAIKSIFLSGPVVRRRALAILAVLFLLLCSVYIVNNYL